MVQLHPNEEMILLLTHPPASCSSEHWLRGWWPFSYCPMFSLTALLLISVVVCGVVCGDDLALDSSHSCSTSSEGGGAFSDAECFLAASLLISNQKLIFLFSLSRSARIGVKKLHKRVFSCTLRC